MNQPGLDPGEALRLRELHHALEHQAIRLAEALGEAAAHRVVRESIPGDWEPVHFPGAGAGLPDVVYRDRKTGKLLILEAKGGSSTLGTRMDVHGRARVEQGTRAYLESLAADMRKSGDAATRALGTEIQRQLARPDGIDYRVVRQPFDDATGRPLTPEVGRFDLGLPPGAAEQGHRAAAAVPGSRFHGEALPGHVRVSEDTVHGAVRQLIEFARAGVATRMRPAPDADGIYIVEHPDGRSTRVRLETVAPERLGADAAGRRNNAEWDTDADGPADFVIRVSERADPRQIERALAHDFREVAEIAFEGGPSRQPVTPDEHGLDLASPHGRARLEEVHWLAGRIGDGDPHGVFRYELDRLMAHLGAAADTSDSRRAAVLAALAGQGLLTDRVRQALGAEPAAGAPLPPRPTASEPTDAPAPAPRLLPSGTIGPERQLAHDLAADLDAELSLPQQPATRAGPVCAALAQQPDLVRQVWTAPGDEHFERLLTRLTDELALPREDGARLRAFFIDARRRRTAEAMGMDTRREAGNKLAEAQARGEIDAATAVEVQALIDDSWYAARQFYAMSPQRFIELYRGFRASGHGSFFAYLEGRGGRMRTEERALLGELTAQSVLGERGHLVLGGRDGKLPPQRVLVAGPEGPARIEPTGAGTGISEVKQPGIDVISVAADGVVHLVDNKAYAQSSGAIGPDRLESVFVRNIVDNLEAELPRLRQLAADLAAGPAHRADDVISGVASDQQIVRAVGNLDAALTALKAAAPLQDLSHVVRILSAHGVKLGVMTEMGTAGVHQQLLDAGVEHLT
jgi:hypothetical protein